MISNAGLWGKEGPWLWVSAQDRPVNYLGNRGERKGTACSWQTAAPWQGWLGGTAPRLSAWPHTSQRTFFKTCLWLHTASQHGGGQHKFMAAKRRSPKTQGENAGVTVSAKRKSPDQEFTPLHIPCVNRGKSLPSFTVNLYTLPWMPWKV